MSRASVLECEGVRVHLVMALSADGITARHGADPVDWTEAADKSFFAAFTKKCGVILMGSRTFATLPGALPDRKNIVFTRSPEGRQGSSNLVFTAQTPKEVVGAQKKAGFQEVALIGGANLNTAFAKAGCIDDIWLTVSPRMFGAGLSLFSEPLALPLVLKEMRPLGAHSVLLHYQVVKAV